MEDVAVVVAVAAIATAGRDPVFTVPPAFCCTLTFSFGLLISMFLEMLAETLLPMDNTVKSCTYA